MPKPNLLERGQPELVDVVMQHPFQLEATGTIRGMLKLLREIERPEDFYNFQVLLFHQLHRVQQAAAEATTKVKRLRRGKSVSEAPSGDWEIERTVAKRLERQFRSLGDALAWKCFGYNRRFIAALSNNQASGPMFGKAGLQNEIGAVIEMWKSHKTFCLLNDLTNCVRVGDLIQFGDRPVLLEIKSDPRRGSPAQLARMQAAIDVINDRATLSHPKGEATLFTSSVQLKTHLRRLDEALSLADRQGPTVIKLQRGWVLSAFSATGPALEDEKKALGKLESTTARWMTGSTQRLQTHSFEAAARNPALAPYAAFPISIDNAARLTCDYAVFNSVLEWNRLAEAMSRQGLRVEGCALPAESGRRASDFPVLHVRLGVRRLTLTFAAIMQLLFEMVDLDVFAAATAESLQRVADTAPVVITFFRNEKATWRSAGSVLSS